MGHTWTAEEQKAHRKLWVEPIAYLRDLQPQAEDEALAVCINGDPGSFPVYADPPSEQWMPAEAQFLRELVEVVPTTTGFTEYERQRLVGIADRLDNAKATA